VTLPSDVPKLDVVGVPLAVTDYEQAMEVMDGMIERGERGYLTAAAVHVVMVARHDPETRRALAEASLVLPDGRPLMWALNLLGAGLRDRVYGPELTVRYCQRAAESGHRLWLYGGATPEDLADLARVLGERYPGIVVAGSWSPPHRPLTDGERRELAERINADRADVVLVGVGAPKQEKWMARMRPLLDAPVLAGVGAAFDFISGRKRQAPAWMQRRGLEWLFRLSQDPVRLLPRYLRYNPAFVAAFARQYISERVRRR
jgi:N-acetylglucosaminyldiphosphoundecaprenol N-acetyl-beta-D-mannosaminyltransferase